MKAPVPKLCLYGHYSCSQRGGNVLPVFRGKMTQEGYGLGGLLRSFMRTIIPVISPVIKRAVKHVGKRALNTGGKVLGDVISGRKIAESIKHRGLEGIEELKSEGLEHLSHRLSRKSRGIKRKKTPRKSTVTVKKRRKQYQDIFS